MTTPTLASPDTIPPQGRILAFDWGAARIGVAVSDPTRTLATPRTAIAEKDKARQIARAVDCVRGSQAVAVVVGLPVHLDGTPGTSARNAAMFAEKLRAGLGVGNEGDQVPVVLVDERFTTRTAAQHLAATRSTPSRRDGSLDSASAAVLLQAFLDGLATPAAPDLSDD